MTQRFSAKAWLAWTFAAGFLVLVTRNPIYLSLLLGSIFAVYLTLEHRSSIALAWSVVLRIGLAIAGISILFNVLTVHSGDRQFGSLPSSWPIIGGALTWNAVLYGAISGMALMCLLMLAATLSSAVDRSALVRMTPRSLGATGIAAAAALSIFPQTIQAISQVREAHRARGFRLRSIRDVQRLIIPVLDLGLERAFHLAESMESRGFGNRVQSARVPGAVTIAVLAMATTGIVLLGIGYPFAGGATLASAGIAFMLIARRFRAAPIAHYRESRFHLADVPLLFASSAMITITAAQLLSEGSSLAYSTYPRLTVPDFSILLALACILTIFPAVLPGEKQSEPVHA